jgi:hypothetical protein
MDRAEAIARIPDANIEVYVPDHRLADEWAARLRSIAPHLSVQVIRGRDYEDRLGPMCARADLAREIAKAGFSVTNRLCRVEHEDGTEQRCSHYESCLTNRYLSQFANGAPAVRIMPHEYLRLPRPTGQPKPDFIIIDERFWPVAVAERSFGVDRLLSHRRMDWFGRVNAAEIADLLVAAKVVHDALQEGAPLLGRLRHSNIGATELRAAARAEFGGADDLAVSPAMSDDDLRATLQGYRRSDATKLYRMWKCLEKEIDTGRGHSHSVELRRNVPTVMGLQDVVYVNWRRDLRIGKTPTLLIDADLDHQIARLFLPRIEIIELSVDRKAEVVQVVDTPASKTRLVRGSPRWLSDVEALIEAQVFLGRRVLVVASKEVAKAIKQIEGSEVTWFGAIRGKDRWRDSDSAIIIGREQIPPLALEGKARALWYDRTEPLTFLRPTPNGNYAFAQEVRGYRLRSKQPVGQLVAVHPDPDIQRVLEQVRECESAQAIDRLRLIHASKPKLVYILSNVVLDITVDRLVRWNEIVPSAIERAILRRLPALPLVPVWLAEKLPELFSSVRTAERAVRRLRKTATSLIISSTTHMAVYRLPGQKNRSRALVSKTVENPRTALEAIVGPVVEFNIICESETRETSEF